MKNNIPTTTTAEDLSRCLGSPIVTVTVVGVDGRVESVTTTKPEPTMARLPDRKPR